MLLQVMYREWHKLKDVKLSDVEDIFGKETILTSIYGAVDRTVDVPNMLTKSVKEAISPIYPWIKETVIPATFDLGSQLLLDKMEELLIRLKLEEVVRDQVESFSLKEVEEMVLSVSRRELKLITFLGALLGGLIGFLQGVLVLFL